MLKNLLCILLILHTLSASSQRYLTNEFPQIDSIIGGIYGSSSDYQSITRNLLYDFYSPANDAEQKRPLIIYIHGGGFNTGTRSYPSIKLLCRRMAMKGYAVANIDYRLDPTFEFYNSNTNRRAMADAMHDAKQAIRYFKANAAQFKLDTNKIFIGGESAGAATAMMASFVDKQSEMAVYPMANPNNPVGSNSNPGFGNGVHATMCLCGVLLDTAAIEKATDPPILWTHGSADTYIPLALSFNIVLRATHIGLPVQIKLYQGATHCPWYFGNPNWEAYLDSTITDITSFLYPKVVTPVGINEPQRDEVIKKIYPNPTPGDLTIELDKYYSQVNISVVSGTGQVAHRSAFQNSKRIQLDVKHLVKGIYLLKMELNKTFVVTDKIMIQEK